MKHALLLPILSLGLLVAACGEDGPAPFTIQLQSVDVVQTAVDRIEVLFKPSSLDQHFNMVEDGTHFSGTVFTRVTASGDYLIQIEREYIDNYARPGGSTFLLDVPVYSTGSGTTTSSPSVQVTFIRRDERIATAERFVAWPLPPGEESVMMVRCLIPDFRRQCTNNDPLPMTDSGTGAPDAGM